MRDELSSAKLLIEEMRCEVEALKKQARENETSRKGLDVSDVDVQCLFGYLSMAKTGDKVREILNVFQAPSTRVRVDPGNLVTAASVTKSRLGNEWPAAAFGRCLVEVQGAKVETD